MTNRAADAGLLDEIAALKEAGDLLRETKTAPEKGRFART
jgi:hypothetical protein